MRAVAIEAFGGPEEIEVLDLPRPEPGPEEVLISVRAAGVGPWDVKTREGFFGERAFPCVLGSEGSGVVEEVGEVEDEVSGLSVGDEVIFNGAGAHAEYTSVSSGVVAPKPASLSFEAAAALPIGGLTAYQGLVEEIGLTEGETVLIAGAAGGVGTMAVQIARSLGARVIGTASPNNHDYLLSLGADEAVDYNAEDWTQKVWDLSSGGVGAAFDCVGGETFHHCFEAVRDGGRVVTIAAFGEESGAGRGIEYHAFGASATSEKLGWLAGAVESGDLRVELEDTLPLEEAAEAQRRIERGHTRGKIVLSL